MQREPHEAAPGVHGGERAEPTAKPQQPQRLDPIDVFAPQAGEDEKALRRRIHRAHGAATARAQRSQHGRARTVYWITAQLAADWVFQQASVDELQEIISALARMFMVAAAFERLEAPDADG